MENIIAVVPGTAPHNYGLVEKLEQAGGTIIRAPNLHTNSETFLNRDTIAVEHMQTLLAFPNHPTPYRSGTWATINRARKMGRRVRMYPFDKLNK